MFDYAIVGTGAVGGFIGWYLVNAGHTVHFVARSHYGALVTDGLALTEDGNRLVHSVNVFSRIDALPPVDVIIASAKTTDIPKISAQIARHSPSTTVVAFQNGLNPESLYATASPDRIILGGVAYLSAQMSPPATVQVEGRHRLVIGAQVGAGDRAETTASKIVEQFRAAGLYADLSHDLRLDRWTKVGWSLMFAGPCTILDVDTRQLVRSQATRDLLDQIFQEARSVAHEEGVTLPPNEPAAMIAEAASSPGHVVSMTIDRRLGRSLEDDAIYGAVRRRAYEVGIRTPIIDTVHSLLNFASDAGALGDHSSRS